MEHECAKNPMPDSKVAFEQMRDRIPATVPRHYFPCSIRVGQGNDGMWYLKLHDEFAVPIAHCPFCGSHLA